MHVVGFLSRWFENRSVIRHSARQQALLKAVKALLGGGRLSLTHLGRRRPGDAHVKHHIKAIDRLLGISTCTLNATISTQPWRFHCSRTPNDPFCWSTGQISTSTASGSCSRRQSRWAVVPSRSTKRCSHSSATIVPARTENSCERSTRSFQRTASPSS